MRGERMVVCLSGVVESGSVRLAVLLRLAVGQHREVAHRDRLLRLRHLLLRDRAVGRRQRVGDLIRVGRRAAFFNAGRNASIVGSMLAVSIFSS